MNCTAPESQDSVSTIYGDNMAVIESIVGSEHADFNGVEFFNWKIWPLGSPIFVCRQFQGKVKWLCDFYFRTLLPSPQVVVNSAD